MRALKQPDSFGGVLLAQHTIPDSGHIAGAVENSNTPVIRDRKVI
jgi:hypothetical protein